MKQLTTLALLLLTLVSFSQKKFEGKATYMSKRTIDMSRFDKMSEQQKKQMKARFKNFLEKTKEMMNRYRSRDGKGIEIKIGG